MGSADHDNHAVEMNANIRAYEYFMKNVPGFNSNNWFSVQNPIKGYNWSLSYNDSVNQLALKEGRIRVKWWDYLLGPTIIVPGIINVLNLKQ